MTTARRAARAAGGDLPRQASEDLDVIELLRDRKNRLWKNPKRYREFMEQHGWHLSASERLGGTTHPNNRHNHAAAQWGVENGIESHPNHADLNQLRRMGLYG